MSLPKNDQSLQNPLILQGNKLEDLRSIMVSWMQRHPLQPLDDEVILVQSNGIAQWLKLALAADPDEEGGLGIAAGIKVMLPGRFIWQAYRKLYPELPAASPFDKGPLTWRLLDLLNRLPELSVQAPDPETLQPLETFIKQDASVYRSWQLAARLADLYDQYQVYRADWLDAWLKGEDVIIKANGIKKEIALNQRWQPLIWRWLHDDIKASHHDKSFLSYASRSSVHQAFCDYFSRDSHHPLPKGLPKRIIVFGISSLPRQTLEVLDLLSQSAQVMLFVCNPSEHYWGDLIEGRDLFKQAYKRHPFNPIPDHVDENQLHLYGHPLLASWGRQGRDYLRLLDEYDEPSRYRQQFDSIDVFNSPDNDTLLHQLQKDIFDLKPEAERQSAMTQLKEQDRSIEFIIAHSPQREIEILQDYLLAEFEQAQVTGNDLSPRDILVMVPDIQDYAAHIDAVFGKLTRQDKRYLPFHIADQGQRHKAPLLIALEHLLHLPESRFNVSELLDLLDVPSLRATFELTEKDLVSIKRWIQGANIRWGLHAEQRSALDLPQVSGNTWRFGLKRMLLGYAVGDQDAWQGTLPYAEVAGLEAAKLGSLVKLLDQLEVTWQLLQHPADASTWAERLQQMLKTFFSPESDQDQALILRVEAEIESWLDAITLAEAENLPVTLDVVRDELLSGLDQQSLNQTFLAGSVNFATLMPMRAIPFKQIWLLGMNDGAYPRAVRPVDFDLMAQDYRPGDRSRREDDRYLFLEALLSARDKLVISWVGRSVRDNSVRPPSVLVGQLRDHLQAGWIGQSGNLLNELTCEHPLQPFSEVYFSDQTSLYSYASEWLAVHRSDPKVHSAFEPMDAWQPETALSVSQLTQLIKLPLDSFYALRLQVPRVEAIQQLSDTESFSFNGLDIWQLRDQLMQTSIRPSVDQQDYQQRIHDDVVRLQQQGVLVEGSLGEYQGKNLTDGLEKVYHYWAEQRLKFAQSLEAQTVSFQCETPWGAIAIEETLSSLYRDIETGEYALLLLQSSGLFASGKKRRWPNYVRGWLLHLLANLMGQPASTHIITPEGQIHFPSIDDREEAKQILNRLLGAALAALQTPSLISIETAMVWLEAKDKDGAVSIDDPDLQGKLLDALSKSFQKSRFLQHHCHDLEALWNHAEFERQAIRLYGDFFSSVQLSKRGSS